MPRHSRHARVLVPELERTVKVRALGLDELASIGPDRIAMPSSWRHPSILAMIGRACVRPRLTAAQIAGLGDDSLGRLATAILEADRQTRGMLHRELRAEGVR